MTITCFDRDRIECEIQWLKKKISEVEIKARTKPSAVREIGDLRRQVKERELSLWFDAAQRKGE